MTVKNVSGASLTLHFAVSAATGTGVAYTVDTPTATLAAGASVQVGVTMSAEKGAALGGHQATLTISSGSSEIAHAVVYTFVK